MNQVRGLLRRAQTAHGYVPLDDRRRAGREDRRVAPRMQAGLRSYADHRLVGDVRGVGLIGAIEIVRDKATKQSFEAKAAVAAFLVRRAQHHGVILRSMPGDIVAFCPPLIVQEGEIDEMLAGFGKALDDTAVMVRDKGLA